MQRARRINVYSSDSSLNIVHANDVMMTSYLKGGQW